MKVKKNKWEEIQLKFSYFHILEVILDEREQGTCNTKGSPREEALDLQLFLYFYSRISTVTWVPPLPIMPVLHFLFYFRIIRDTTTFLF